MLFTSSWPNNFPQNNFKPQLSCFWNGKGIEIYKRLEFIYLSFLGSTAVVSYGPDIGHTPYDIRLKALFFLWKEGKKKKKKKYSNSKRLSWWKILFPRSRLNNDILNTQHDHLSFFLSVLSHNMGYAYLINTLKNKIPNLHDSSIKWNFLILVNTRELIKFSKIIWGISFIFTQSW